MLLAMAIARTLARRNASATADVAAIDAGAGAGILELRSGAAGSPDSAAVGTLLCSITLNDPSFGAPSAGVVTAVVSPVPTGTAVAAGTIGHFRCIDSTGVLAMQGTVTATGGGGDITINTLATSVGLQVQLTSWTHTYSA